MIKKLPFVIIKWLAVAGFDIKKTAFIINELPSFLKDFIKMKKMLRQTNNASFRILKFYPVFGEKRSHNSIPWNYFFQDLWVAQLILQNNPIKHVDVGSRIDGFVAHIATFRQIEVYDIRSVRNDIPNVKFVQVDLCSEKFHFADYCDSISSLHVIEHLGLGRYGDRIDPDAYVKGLRNITKALKNDGLFYLSVPIGKQRIEFNAHRVFSASYIIELLKPYYKLENFGYINDQSLFFPNVSITDSGFDNSFGCFYGCGIFIFRKIKNWI
jgi:SAM-dependent methyltransferase